MTFSYTIIYVKDVASTLDFYEKAFGFKTTFCTPEKDYGELNTGNTKLAFANTELAKSNFSKGATLSNANEKPFAVELAFVSDNIQKDFKQAVEAGATVYEPIEEKIWGQSVGYLRDLNGFLIELCTPMQ